jgi:hypothetical protein
MSLVTRGRSGFAADKYFKNAAFNASPQIFLANALQIEIVEVI